MRWLVASLVCVVAIAWNDVAHGRGSAQLQFVQRAEDHRCPDEAELRRRVGAQLGYDPFNARAVTRIEVTIEPKASRFYGRVRIQHDGATLGERELEPTKDCEALVSALALTISVAIDPIGASREPTPAPAPAPALAPSVVTPAIERSHPEVQTVAPPARLAEQRAEPAATGASRAYLRLAAAPMVSVGIAPAAAAGLSASVGAGWPHVSLALEGRLDLPASARLSIGGDVNTSVALVTFVPCVHVRRWMGCALASVGSMRAESSGISAPAIDYSVFAAVGVRAGLEVPISRVFAVRPQIEGQAALTRPSLELNGRAIWTTPPLAVTLGVAFVVRLGATAPL